ncbi:MAG: type IV pilus secretin PilQ, partial [Myxococcota bacterium]|nr:type IV pilus secretin PilQ [Myxococcota bacterium]
PDAETVMLQIPNARFSGDTGERITPESGGPVSLVTTFEQPDLEGSEVRVVMRRAKGLSPTITRRSTVILVDFKSQGVAATAPPAFLPNEPAFLSEEETYANRLEMEGRLPSDSSNLPGEDVDPDTNPLSELEKGAAEGTVSSHALAAALDHAEAQAVAKAPTPATKVKKTTKQPESLPAALASPAAVDVVSEGGLIDGKKYTGRRISLDFKDVLISDVLRLIAEVSELNIIAGDEVKGSITIRLVDVPWDQALDVILLTKGLGFVRVGNVLRIAPDEILKAEEESRLQERRQKEKLEDLEIKLQPINYADVKEVKGLVSRLLSPRGTVNVDVRTNTVIIKDISGVIDEAVALIRAIDTQTPQVMIEAKIVEANLDFARELGSTWSFGSQPYVDGFSPGSLRTDLGSENFKFAGENNVVIGNPITSAATGTVNFGAFLLDDKMQVDVHIQAMEQAGEGKVISSPRIVTLDNREAIIEQGVSIPFQTFESGDAKLEFIDAVLSLQVTPHITTDKSIIMALEVSRNAPDSSVPTPTGSPAIAKNQAKTETLVKDGQTLVIGGIYTIEKSTRESRVPYLSKIPFLGKAFKSRQVSDKRKELLIFVTPRIVVNPALASN